MNSVSSSFGARRPLKIGEREVDFYSLPAAEKAGAGKLSALPYSLKILAENLLRHEDGVAVTRADIEVLGQWSKERTGGREVAYHPARVLMPDVSGLPLLADMCAMRDAMAKSGGDPALINPGIPVDLIVDHSVMVDHAGSANALALNMAIEMSRNRERYLFLKWAQQAFRRLRLVPPGNGILHQVNVEHLATVVAVTPDADGVPLAHPDCLIGMDSHTTMINALGVMGWGVGGIEAGAAMLGQAVSLLIPAVVGCRLLGCLRPEVTATDLVLTVTRALREHGVVQKFVEFCGPGLDTLPVWDGATLSNMAPEYGATMGFMPVDAQTISYLRTTARSEELLTLVEAYTRAQGMWRDSDAPEPAYSQLVEINLDSVETSLAGPFRPNQRVSLSKVPAAFAQASKERGWDAPSSKRADAAPFNDGVIGLAAITSCTNTSNPAVMIGAGLVARNAVARGLTAKPWVKTSLSPGSRVVSDYLLQAGLQAPLDALGFHTVGYGCMTCMGNSGALHESLAAAVVEHDVAAVAVLSGNRNFENRVHAQCKAAFLASPPLVVAYAIAGTVNVDLRTEPLGLDQAGQPVYLADIWPGREEVMAVTETHVNPTQFRRRYGDSEDHNFTQGSDDWQAIDAGDGTLFDWDQDSDYLLQPPYFDDFQAEPDDLKPVRGAKVLVMVGDSVTTDHISPVSAIVSDSGAGRYLQARGVKPVDFNNFASRRGNHEVMMRGTLSNLNLVNELAPGEPGGITRYLPSGDLMSVYDAAMRYAGTATPLVVVAGREYGTGSSRDWAAKGVALLGVKVVIAESFERIHRSNLVGMGVLPLQFPVGVTRHTLGLDGSETYHLELGDNLDVPQARIGLTLERSDGTVSVVRLESRLDTEIDISYYRHGGMLPYVLRRGLEQSLRS